MIWLNLIFFYWNCRCNCFTEKFVWFMKKCEHRKRTVFTLSEVNSLRFPRFWLQNDIFYRRHIFITVILISDTTEGTHTRKRRVNNNLKHWLSFIDSLTMFKINRLKEWSLKYQKVISLLTIKAQYNWFVFLKIPPNLTLKECIQYPTK